MKKNLLLLSMATLIALNLLGQTWTLQTTPTPLGHLNKIQFIDSLRGWSVGQHYSSTASCISTTNSGTTWGMQYPPTYSLSTIASLFFVNTNYGFLTATYGSSELFKTSNGGANWININGPSISGIHALYFTDTANGLAGGNNSGGTSGMIEKTINGGTSWSQVWINSPGSGDDVRQIQMLNSSLGYACTQFGNILKTIDGGSTWTSYSTGFSQSLFGISFVNSNIGWAVGLGGLIIKTTNGGLNWTLQVSGTSDQLNSVSFIDTLRGWCCGGTKIYYTINGGQDWYSQLNTSSNALNCIQMLNSRVGFACGNNGSVYKYICTPSSTSLVRSICSGQSTTIGTQSFNATGNYTVALVSVGGCDSVVHLNLTVNPLPVPIITNNSGVLSTGSFTSYQWLYGATPLTGETSQSLTPTYNGTYFVIVIDANGCTDTSAAYFYTGIEETEIENSIVIFPNPTSSDFTVTFPKTAKQIQITNSLGQFIQSRSLSGLTTEEFIIDENGVYFICITTDKYTITRKIVVVNKK